MKEQKIQKLQAQKNNAANNAKKIKYIMYTLNGICFTTTTCALGCLVSLNYEHAFPLGLIAIVSHLGAQDTYSTYKATNRDIKKLRKRINDTKKQR